MKIGIDVDNTITTTLPVMKAYCKKYNDEVVKRNLKMNEKGFSTGNLYKWTWEERIDFCNKFLKEIALKAEIKEGASEVIKKLKEENQIYIITARRKPYFEEPYSITKNFLDKNDIYYDELIVECEDKYTFCVENNIDIMIDDEPQNINSIAQVIPVIVFQEIYNEQCEGKNIIKVNSWQKVYDIVKRI